jgi:hypothetical protein
MYECDILNERSLLCTNILQSLHDFVIAIKKNGKCCLPNRVNTRMHFQIRDTHFVFVFENI